MVLYVVLLYVIGLIVTGHIFFFLNPKDLTTQEGSVVVILWPILAIFLAIYHPLRYYYKNVLLPARGRAEKAKWDKKNKEALIQRKVV